MFNDLTKSFKSDKRGLYRILSLVVLFALTSFVYNLSRPLKISISVGEKNAGAEVIPYLKFWGILPSVFLFASLFIILSNKLSREKVFLIFVGIFATFFVLFKTYLYPNLDNLIPITLTNYLTSILPVGAKGFIQIIYYWPISLFYILAELWGTVILYTLLWGFINEITKLQEAKKSYIVFTFASNFSCALAGYIGIYFSDSVYSWENSFSFLLNTAIFCMIAIAIIFKAMHYYDLIDPEEAAATQQATVKKLSSKKMDLWQSLSQVFKNKHLLYIALIVLSYNIASNLGETIWTAQLKETYKQDKNSIARYIYYVTMFMGLFAMYADFFITRITLAMKSWTFTALLTPIVFLSTGVIFYSLIMLKHFSYNELCSSLTSSLSAQTIIIIGAGHICMTRAARATFMDASKEIAYVPLSTEQKRKGKAVIDSISSRLGKAGGSAIYQVLLLSMGTITATTPYVVCILLILSISWIYAIRKIGSKVDLKN